MKTLIPAAIRCSLVFTAVAALSIVYPASVQAVPTTYKYTGNPFTDVEPPYTTSDYVTVMMTLAEPLPSNFHGDVTPTAFTISDGVQTFTNTTPDISAFFLQFVTNARGEITFWAVVAQNAFLPELSILTVRDDRTFDGASTLDPEGLAGNLDNPGVWGPGIATPDAGSTLSLMTLTLMALGLLARRFQRAAG